MYMKILRLSILGRQACFIIKVWLVTLIGLTTSLSTSKFSEMIKSVHVQVVVTYMLAVEVFATAIKFFDRQKVCSIASFLEVKGQIAAMHS